MDRKKYKNCIIKCLGNLSDKSLKNLLAHINYLIVNDFDKESSHE